VHIRAVSVVKATLAAHPRSPVRHSAPPPMPRRHKNAMGSFLWAPATALRGRQAIYWMNAREYWANVERVDDAENTASYRGIAFQRPPLAGPST
jgi:hypothetical protein